MAAAAAKVEWDGEELHGRLVFLGKTCTTSTNIDIAITKSLFFPHQTFGSAACSYWHSMREVIWKNILKLFCTEIKIILKMI